MQLSHVLPPQAGHCSSFWSLLVLSFDYRISSGYPYLSHDFKLYKALQQLPVRLLFFRLFELSGLFLVFYGSTLKVLEFEAA